MDDNFLKSMIYLRLLMDTVEGEAGVGFSVQYRYFTVSQSMGMVSLILN